MKWIKAFLFLMVVCMIFCFFMLYRNHWVYKTRTNILLGNSCKEYKQLWSYDEMMNHFWIWDVDKMKHKTTKGLKK